jgi:hypothetical protein
LPFCGWRLTGPVKNSAALLLPAFPIPT